MAVTTVSIRTNNKTLKNEASFNDKRPMKSLITTTTISNFGAIILDKRRAVFFQHSYITTFEINSTNLH